MNEEKAINAAELEKLLTEPVPGRHGPPVNCLKDVLVQLTTQNVEVSVYPRVEYSAGEIVVALSDCVVIKNKSGLDSAWVDYFIQPYASSTTFVFRIAKPKTSV